MTADGAAEPWAAAPRLHNRVLPVLVLLATAAATAMGFVVIAPNRLLPGVGVPLWQAAAAPATAGFAAAAALLLTLCWVRPRGAVHYGTAAVAGAVLLAAPAVAGASAAQLLGSAPPASVASLAGGFWVVGGCAALAAIDSLQRAQAGAAVQLVTAAVLAGGFLALSRIGAFDALSLSREYAARHDLFGAAVLRHAELVAAALGAAVAIGVPLGLAALRRKRFEAPLFAVLNLLQTVPSIALFGLLIAPLSGLADAVPALRAAGIGGVGPAPAIIALVLYALLPIARNTVAGIGGVSPAAIEAARGMGMTGRQVFWRVETPLALPVLLAGLRIVVGQTVGLAVVAALIGAGGLGSFVFEGLGQYATDLVLLGALPAILMALGADFVLRLAARAMPRRGAA
ncbi:MAG: ABC transporter permease [Alphaproteobacteria bacterium]|nr:ABC transporter permease [Alphaproteobacteria bacterium]